jgi:hypothetical protein
MKRKLLFGPIRLKRKPAADRIAALREDLHDLAMVAERREESAVGLASLKKQIP